MSHARDSSKHFPHKLLYSSVPSESLAASSHLSTQQMVIWKYHKAENLNSYKPKREIRSSPLIFLFRKLKSALLRCNVYYTGENENGGTRQIKLAPLTGNYFSQPFSKLCVWISPWTYWTWRSFYAKVVSKSQLSTTTNQKAAWPVERVDHCCPRRPGEHTDYRPLKLKETFLLSSPPPGSTSDPRRGGDSSALLLQWHYHPPDAPCAPPLWPRPHR